MSDGGQQEPNSKASASCDLSANGLGTTSRTSPGCNQSCDTKACAGATFGHRAHHDFQLQQRSEGGPSTMAMLRDTLSNEASCQHLRVLDPLCNVQPEIAVHSKERQFKCNYQGREPCDGAAHVATTTSVDGQAQTQLKNLPGDAEEDRRRGDPDDRDPECFTSLPKGESKSDTGISIDSVSKLPLECGGPPPEMTRISYCRWNTFGFDTCICIQCVTCFGRHVTLYTWCFCMWVLV